MARRSASTRLALGLAAGVVMVLVLAALVAQARTLHRRGVAGMLR
jgi:hypothetical protein